MPLIFMLLALIGIVFTGMTLHVPFIENLVLDYISLPMDFMARFEEYIYGVLSVLLIIPFLRRRNKSKLLRKFKKTGGIKKISWQEFEELTGQLYRARGYRAEVKGGSGGDGGIDVLLKKGGKTWIVQCKHWQTKKVGINIIREMYGVMMDQKAHGAKIVTSGQFTKQCFEFVKGKPIELIDGRKLLTIAKN